MSYRVSELHLYTTNPTIAQYQVKDQTISEGQLLLKNLGQINIFIGANNSGKSRFLREVFSSFAIRKPIKGNMEMPYKGVDLSFIPIESVETALSSQKIRDAIDEQTGDFATSKTIESAITSAVNSTIEAKKAVTINDIRTIIDKIYEELNRLADTLQQQPKKGTNFATLKDLVNKALQAVTVKELHQLDLHATYIPVLRGLRKIPHVASADEYKNRTFLDYFPGMSQRETDVFTGIELFDTVRRLLLSEYKDRQKISAFEGFLGNNFFNGQKVSLIPRQFKDLPATSENEEGQRENFDLYVKIGKHKERPIYELGDGIQAVILLTFPLFEHQDKNHLLFIDEPEHFLHPGFQRVFIEAVRLFPNAQLYFTTHSNNFLDMTLEAEKDISVYSFQNDNKDEVGDEIIPRFLIENVSNTSQSVLDLLGVRSSSVFLANCTIWVEGITDRLYIRRYLQVYQEKLPPGKKRFKEDTHFAFVEYAGSNITHWSFLEDAGETDEVSRRSKINVKRICNKLFLIADQDGASGPNEEVIKDKNAKYTRHQQLQQILGNRFHRLPCREIENLLSPRILRAVVQLYEQIDADPFNAKITYEDYRDKLLGEYLDSQLMIKKRKRSYKAPSGTLAGKVDFAHRAVESIKSRKDLTADALSLCDKLYEFIEQCNGVSTKPISENL